MHIRSLKTQESISHVYLRGAAYLRTSVPGGGVSGGGGGVGGGGVDEWHNGVGGGAGNAGIRMNIFNM